MLALARKPGQSVRIGDDVQLTVLGVKSDGLAQLRIKATQVIRMGHRQVPVPPNGEPCVLLCRAGEGFRIGEGTLISIARVTPGRVVIAVDADRSISVDREEVYSRRRHRPASQGP